jgi:hypothetical protein
MASLAPFGLSVSQKHVGQTREYIIRSSDTNAYGIGDPVKSTDVIFQGRLPDGRPTQGLPGVTKAASGDRIRGVIVGMAPAQIGTDSMSIPATKARDYVVLVNDDPRTVYEIQADNTAILGTLAGSYANFVAASPAGSVSGIYLDSTSFNASAGDFRVLSVERNEGVNSVLRVLPVFHEDTPPSKAWKVMGAPGSAAAADISGYLRTLSAAGGGTVLFPPSTTPWILDDEILMANNTAIILSPGVTITRPDPFTLTCTTVSGSPNVTVVDGTTSSIKTSYYKAHYVVGTGIPVAARISSVTDGTRFMLDANATASGTVTLTFHYAHNIIRRSGIINTRIIAPWGRATLDGNAVLSPFEFASTDAIRNCIRTENCQDVETSGLLLTNAHYHGEVGTTNVGKVRINNVRTYRNGYRGIHYHGDSPSSAIADVQIDDIEVDSDGWKAYQVQSDQLNSGFFVVYDNMSRVQIGKVRVKGCPGLGVHLNGNISTGVRSGGITYSSIVCENVGVPVGLFNGLRGISIDSVQARGKLYTFANSTLGSGTSQLPLILNATGYVSGALMQSIDLPVGTDMTTLDIGYGVFLQDVTGGLDVRLAIWSIDATNRRIWVYNYATPTARPWVIDNDGLTTATVTIWTCRGPAVIITGSDSNSQDLQDIRIGSVQCDTIGGKTLSATNLGASVRYINGLHIGSYSARDCYSGVYLYNFTDLCVGAFSAIGSGNRRTGNDSANVDLTLLNAAGGTIGRAHIVSKTSGSMTRNGATLLALNSANISNIKIFDVVVENGNASAFAIDWTNSVNVMLGDPRTTAGTALTPTGTATNGSAFRYGLS